MLRWCASIAIVVGVLSAPFGHGGALAQTSPAGPEEPSPEKVRKATELYAKGKSLLEAGQTTEALDALEQSYAAVPSPNSSLLIARCLRDMDRVDAAIRRYEQTESEAKAKLDAGEAKYKPTADAAIAERQDLLAKVGTISVRVKGAPAGSEVELGGARTALASDGRLSLRAMPGEAKVTIHPYGKEPVTRTVNVGTGSESVLELDLGGPAPSETTPGPDGGEPGERRWMLPAAIGAGGVGVVGMSLFIGFGVSSQATYDELVRKCGTSCQGRRSDVEAGANEQTAANVGLAIGLVGLAAGGTLFTLWYLDRKAHGKPLFGGAPLSFESLAVTVGPQQMTLRGTF